MKTFDRIVFSVIAVALMMIALQPWVVGARSYGTDVNIASIGGYRIFGPHLPTK